MKFVVSSLLLVTVTAVTVAVSVAVAASAAVPSAEREAIMAARRDAVVEAARFAFEGYRKFAWGQDELRPVSNTARQWLGLGATIVSGMDTLHLMNLTDEFALGLDWIEHDMNVRNGMVVPTFETNIRILGGLLGAYTLTEEPVLLKRAVEVGDVLANAFKCGKLPNPTINLGTGACVGSTTNLASMGTFSLEFVTLSALTGNKTYAQLAETARNNIWQAAPPKQFLGLEPQTWNAVWGQPEGSSYSLGGGSDSFYEYVVKEYLLTDKTNKQLYDMSNLLRQGADKYLFRHSSPSNWGFVDTTTLPDISYSNQMQHLACFAGGMFILQDQFIHANKSSPMGKAIGHTCYEMYKYTRTFLGPENVQVATGGDAAATDSVSGGDFVGGDMANFLRPEALETLTYLYWTTGNTTYQDWGWEMFLAFNTTSRVGSGFSGVRDVNASPVSYDDDQQAYFFSETLKYMFLLFNEPGYMGLNFDDYVFTTEAHPLKVIRSS